ncbi:unnamed protein product [Calypogeia fissa]
MVVDWSSFRWRDGERWAIDVSNVTVRQLMDLLDANKRLKSRKQQKKVDMKVAPHHFEKGVQQWVYEARKRNSGQTHVVRMVAKRFKKGPHDRCLYLRQMELQAIGKIFANAFNQAVRNKLLAAKIMYLDLTKVETLKVNGHYYNLEGYHPGLFVKYNNNNNNNVAYSGGYEYEYFSTILQTFSHWTYQETWGKMMLTDF